MNKLSISLTRAETTFGFVYLAVQLFILQAGLTLANLALGSPLTMAQLNFAFFFINFLCTTLIFHRFLLVSGKLILAFPLRCLRIAFFGFVLNWIANFVISILITIAFPDFQNVNDSSIQALTQENYALMTIGTVFLAPVAEELLYRGLIFGSLYNRSKILAYTLSSGVFACLHVVGYIGLYSAPHLLLCFLQYIPPALILGWVYAKSDTIWTPILLHIAVNQLAILSMR